MGRSDHTFSERDSVGTPPEIFEPIMQILDRPIGLDPCSHPGSLVPAAVRYYLPEYAPAGMPHGQPVALSAFGATPAHVAVVGDGLVMPWGPNLGLVYCNPPYSKLKSAPWILRAHRELALIEELRGALRAHSQKRLPTTPGCPDEIVWLLPVRTAGSWWQIDLTGTADVITFLDRRVKHTGEPDPSPFHQALAYRGSRARLWKEKAEKLLGWSVYTVRA